MKAQDPDWLTVAEKICDECLFSKRRVVSQARRDDILASCDRTGRAFQCHKFTLAGEHAVCRGFFARRASMVIRLALMLNRVRFVPLP